MDYQLKIFLLFITLIALFSVSAISAADVSGNNATDFEMINDNANVSCFKSNNVGGSFSDIQSKVNDAKAGSTLILNNNFSSNSGQIVISKNMVIDGKGNVLDAMSKTDSSILNIKANVNLMNIVFKNSI